jgi:hypothetical protein
VKEEVLIVDALMALTEGALIPREVKRPPSMPKKPVVVRGVFGECSVGFMCVPFLDEWCMFQLVGYLEKFLAPGCPVSAIPSDKGVGMSTKPHKPEPSEWLRLLTGNRLQTQVSRSGVLVGGALGVMALDLAAALIVLGGGGAYTLSILALLALGASFGLAMRALLQPGAKEAGPTLAAMRRAREVKDAHELEDALLDDLEEDLETHDRAVARKTLLFEGALRFLAFAILVELVGRVVQ